MYLSNKMKTMFYIIGAVALSAMVILFLILSGNDTPSYCGEDNEYGLEMQDGICVASEDTQIYTNYYFLYSNVANSPKVDLTAEENIEKIKNQLYPSIVENKSTSIKFYSITPSLTEFSTHTFKGNAASTSKQQSNINDMQKYFQEYTQKNSTAATEDHVDYLKNIQKIARQTAKKEKSIIYVSGSGLSDSGDLDFSKSDILNMDPDDVIEILENKGFFKSREDYEGLTIKWINLGETTEPERTLKGNEIDNLKQLYTTIYNRLGVNFECITMGTKDPDETEYIVNIAYNPNITTENYYIEFIGGSAEYIDKQDAEKQLDNAIKKAKSSFSTITITGYMSRGTCDNSTITSLPLDRANTVKNTLVESGVSENRIITENGGFGPYEECAGGIYNTELGQKNRYISIQFSE